MKAATVNVSVYKVFAKISIHAAREGGDSNHAFACVHRPKFQSTPPVKAATLCPPKNRQCASISIHAAREGGDAVAWYIPPLPLCISIHAAREGGDVPDCRINVTADRFQSTPPVKAATNQQRQRRNYKQISIHAAREGGDEGNVRLEITNPISIHAAREGGDGVSIPGETCREYFNPRRP